MNARIVRTWLLFCVLMVVSSMSASAQGNPPWPPDPETLFAPGVEVVSVEETQSTIEVTACGVSSFMNSGWVYYVDDARVVHVCKVETGEILATLSLTPEEVGYIQHDFNRAFLSPDKAWLVYAHDVAIPGTNGQRVVSAYRLADGHINLIGTIDLPVGLNHPNIKGFGDWLSDTRGTMRIDILGDSVGDNYYVFDVTQPDSLEAVAQGFYENDADAPGRFEVVTTGFIAFRTTMQGHFDCIFSLYDDQGAYELNLGYDCIGARVLPGGGQYFTLQLEVENATTSNLLRFDPHTDERSVLLSGELEWLVGVSPDGRYVLLMMDDNGQLELAHEDFMNLYNFTLWGYLSFDDPSRIVVWDSHQNAIIHEITVTPESDEILPRYHHSWCGDNCLLYAYACTDYAVLPVTLLRFDDEGEVTSQSLEMGCHDISLEDSFLYSPSKQYVFHTSPPPSLLELNSGEIYPLFAEAYGESYRVLRAEWLDDETLKIWLRLSDTRQYGEMAYTLRVTAAFDGANEP